jgi:murein DD-endopeptidase MepM/ murein hydrolase activator NlpD
MRPLPVPLRRRVRGRLTTTLLAVLLAIALVALSVAAPATALRSGPDVPLRSEPDPTLRAVPDVALRTGLGVALRADVGPGSPPDPTGYVPPVAGVDPPAGVERLFDPPEQEWGPGHRGVDLIAAAGSRVLSPGAGVVTFAGQVARRGVVVVTHPDGLRTSLEPVSATVPVGTAVVAGARIGVVEGSGSGGGSGGGTPPNHCAPRSCVHWGVRRGERYIDPLSLLDRPPIVLLPDR